MADVEHLDGAPPQKEPETCSPDHDAAPEEKLYSIGEVSKICNVSKKALRFYDKIAIISPDYISAENNYRYYSRETLLFVPVIKYYKQMGFKLEEMKNLMSSNRYEFHARKLRDKIDELKKMREEIQIAYTSVNDWYNLIREAEGVIENNVVEVSVKYVEPITACYMVQDFDHHYMDAIINIDWTNYLEAIGHEVTGAVYLYFPDHRDKMAGSPTKAYIFQKGVREIDADKTATFGGKMMLAAYHIGAHDTINMTYQKIHDWAAAHGYKCGAASIERHVTDYWTTQRQEDFVLEILIDIEKS